MTRSPQPPSARTAARPSSAGAGAGAPRRTAQVRGRRLAGLVLAAVTLAACGGAPDRVDTDAPPATSRSTGTEALSGDVVVFAAASLTEAFTELADDFEAANPGVVVITSFGASSTLAQQIVSGAPADVFAAASPSTMAVVADAALADGEPAVFARNRLEIVVPAGNPADVTGLADFADEDLRIALCSAEVPCGAAAAQVFTAAGVTPAPDTLEQDVKATLTKVELGEVDAALVYRTDVLAAGDSVEGIDFPEAAQAVNDYPITVLTDAQNPTAARAFLELVRSATGLRVLADAGFDTA